MRSSPGPECGDVSHGPTLIAYAWSVYSGSSMQSEDERRAGGPHGVMNASVILRGSMYVVTDQKVGCPTSLPNWIAGEIDRL